MNWSYLKRKLTLFDTRGLTPATVRNLNMMISAVMFGTVCMNITGGIAMTGYLKELGASDFMYGLILAMGPIANSFQIVASYIMERRLNRQRMMVVAGIIQRMAWLPFGLVPLFVPMEMVQLRLWIAVLMVVISSIMSPFVNVAFYSIAADSVPMNIRGRYFATRSQLATFAGILGGLIVGFLLDRLPGFTGYSVVFTIAAVTGTLDILLFIFMDLPPMRPAPQRASVFKMIRRVLANGGYMRVVLFFTLWNFAVQISGPFFNVYMREFMGMSNTEITLYAQITANVFSILVVTRWGRALDYYGNKPVVYTAAIIATSIPLLWVFAGPRAVWVVMLVNIIAGSFWCAIDLGAQNLFMGQAPEENRSMYIAVYFIATQLLGIALGNAAGGWLLDNVLPAFENLGLRLNGFALTRYNYLFMISAVLRLSSVLLFLPRVREEGAQTVKLLLNNGVITFRRVVSMNAVAVKRQILARRIRKISRRDEIHAESNEDQSPD